MLKYKRQCKVVFITGASRSGTTLLARILDKNSDIHTMNENHFFGEFSSNKDLDNNVAEAKRVSLIAKLIARQENGIINDSIETTHIRSAESILSDYENTSMNYFDLYDLFCSHERLKFNSGLVCEQTPRNIFYAQHILDNYNHSKIIHIIRDPRGVLASQKMRWKKYQYDNSKTPIIHTIRKWINYHPYTISRMWQRATNKALKLSDNPDVLLVRFEDLITLPDETLKTICHHIGIEFNDSMLDIVMWNSSFGKVDSSKKGMNLRALENWKSKLSSSEINYIQTSTMSLMQQFKYERIANRVTLVDKLFLNLRFIIHVLGVSVLNTKQAIIQLRALYNR